jgi:ABC-type transport system involved in cytochrome c biogenesis permease subunit
MTGSGLCLTLTVILYLAGAALLAANLLLRRPLLLTIGRIAGIGGALCHFAAIGLRCMELHRAPFTSPAESLSLLAWSLAIAFLITEAFWKLSVAGPFALGLSFLLVLLGAALGGHHAPGANVADHHEELLASNVISLHITSIIASIAAFVLAFCCAAFYLIEHRILKSKNGLKWLDRLPSLRLIESTAFTLVSIGFPLLTLGILAGLTPAVRGGLPEGWLTDPKTLLAFMVWLIYGVYLIARLVLNWTPVRTAGILLAGLPLCLLLFLIPSNAHRFG